MDLFEHRESPSRSYEPLAVRMRPQSLNEFVGQEHILGPGKLLTRAIESDRITSLVLFGPPGTGKTTLASVISKETRSFFHPLNAVASNVSEMRKAIDQAKKRFETKGEKTILFIDEIHRFNKAQQDVLMPDVEKGNPILIGATTHNPFFSIVSALLSRSLVFELKPLSEKDIRRVLERALKDGPRGLGCFKVALEPQAMEFLCRASDGDARRALNALELGVTTTPASGDGTVHFTQKVAEESIQKKAVVYDADEDQHYDTISAFIKSMRGSDPDAAIYYLAKMLYAGEDPRFIARRIVICASEDVGNADPQALVLANAALQVSEFIGMPEARIPLAQAVVYIACSPKSNASYLAIDAAMKDVAENKTLEVPDALKGTGYAGAKRLGRGEGYQYAHDFESHFVDQVYLKEKKRYYEPTAQGYEKNFKVYLESLKRSL
ncbi:MAG: replication-associated recombination protein A [Candidatus Omnitrophica bacterium]|nr:replication-associated recombination protein A [Candidatus Omnitrophota bacterium]